MQSLVTSPLAAFYPVIDADITDDSETGYLPTDCVELDAGRKFRRRVNDEDFRNGDPSDSPVGVNSKIIFAIAIEVSDSRHGISNTLMVRITRRYCHTSSVPFDLGEIQSTRRICVTEKQIRYPYATVHAVRDHMVSQQQLVEPVAVYILDELDGPRNDGARGILERKRAFHIEIDPDSASGTWAPEDDPWPSRRVFTTEVNIHDDVVESIAIEVPSARLSPHVIPCTILTAERLEDQAAIAQLAGVKELFGENTLTGTSDDRRGCKEDGNEYLNGRASPASNRVLASSHTSLLEMLPFHAHHG